MTFVEMIIAATVFALVGIFVTYLALASARLSRDSIEALRADNDLQMAMETVGTHLMPAEHDTVVITRDGPLAGQTITFTQQVDDLDPAHWTDPTQPAPKIQITSALTFEPVTNASLGLDNVPCLVYKPNSTDTNFDSYVALRRLEDVSVLGRSSPLRGVLVIGLEDVNFSFTNGIRGRMIDVSAKATARKSYESGATVNRPLVRRETIRLRNESASM